MKTKPTIAMIVAAMIVAAMFLWACSKGTHYSSPPPMKHVYEITTPSGAVYRVRGTALWVIRDWGHQTWTVRDSVYDEVAAGGEGSIIREVSP